MSKRIIHNLLFSIILTSIYTTGCTSLNSTEENPNNESYDSNTLNNKSLIDLENNIKDIKKELIIGTIDTKYKVRTDIVTFVSRLHLTKKQKELMFNLHYHLSQTYWNYIEQQNNCDITIHLHNNVIKHENILLNATQKIYKYEIYNLVYEKQFNIPIRREAYQYFLQNVSVCNK